MKVAFIAADKERELTLANNFIYGLKNAGDDGIIINKTKDLDLDAADTFCMVGVKSLKLFIKCRAAGKNVIYFDKGYYRHRGPSRTWEYWRVCVNDHHPTDYVAIAKHGSARWDKISKRRFNGLTPWRGTDRPGPVIYAGSSEKYHAFAGLPDPTAYAEKIVAEIKKRTNRLVIYRPKPTWLEAAPVKGASFSNRLEDLGLLLPSAWCLVTNGSNASFDAIQAGVPSIVLGRGIGRPISSTSLNDIENPYLASDDERLQWLWNLSWCMFTEEEMKSSLAWAAIRPQFSGEILEDQSLSIVAGKAMKPSKAILKRNGLWKKTWKKAAGKPFTKEPKQ